jgi:hypothetical protein
MTFNNLYSLIVENSASRSYSCLMLDLSFLQQEFLDIQDEICPCEVYESEQGMGLEKEPHITVLYGLHTKKFSDVTDVVDLTPCSFKFKDISLFKNDKYDVLKLDIQSEDLHDLNKEITSKLPFTTNFPKYHPHSTIAYMQPGYGKFYTKVKNKLVGRRFVSNKFIFSDPDGHKIWFTSK